MYWSWVKLFGPQSILWRVTLDAFFDASPLCWRPLYWIFWDGKPLYWSCRGGTGGDNRGSRVSKWILWATQRFSRNDVWKFRYLIYKQFLLTNTNIYLQLQGMVGKWILWATKFLDMTLKYLRTTIHFQNAVENGKIVFIFFRKYICFVVFFGKAREQGTGDRTFRSVGN